MSLFSSPPPPSPPPPRRTWSSPPPPPRSWSPTPPYQSPPLVSFHVSPIVLVTVVFSSILIPVLIYLVYFIWFRETITPVTTTPPTPTPPPATTIMQNQRERRGGLDISTVQMFPVLLNSDVRQLKEAQGQIECAICLSEFEDDEILRMLPGCCHVFHLDCIGTWLALRVTCPVCRISLKEFDVQVQNV